MENLGKASPHTSKSVTFQSVRSEREKRSVGKGVRMLESVTAQVLAAPDMAAVVKILREARASRRTTCIAVNRYDVANDFLICVVDI